MKTLRLGNGGTLPALGLGTWKSAPGEVAAAVKEAVRIGYRHIDCASIYMNEGEVGKAIADCRAEGLVTREELFVTSKLWNDCHADEHVEPALRKSLAALRLEYLDLYLIHWPIALRKGAMMPRRPADLIPLEELPLAQTWSALERCVEAGLVRSIGVSNFSATKLAALAETARIKPAMNQVELHPYLQQPELVQRCRQMDVLLTAYSPLGSFDRPAVLKAEDEPILLEDPVVAELAARRGATPAQVLLAWSLAQGFAVIPKSVRPERLAENLAAAELTLEPADLEELAALDRGRRYVLGDFWEIEGGPYTVEGLWS